MKRLLLLMIFCLSTQAQAQNLFHFGVRLEVNLVGNNPQWQNALLGFQGGMAFQISEHAIFGYRVSGTGNPDAIRFRFAFDLFAHAKLPEASGYIYGGLGYANARIVAATYSDLHVLFGLQLPLGVFVETTIGLGWTRALDFSSFPPKSFTLGPLLTFTLVFGWWQR
jgi:hypothetical protein